MIDIEKRDIPGYEGLYAATEDGRIWSHRQKKFMKTGGEPDNYQIIWLVNENHKGRSEYVHRLIAQTFIPNPDNLPVVNHKDEHKDHNWVDNLEWCTQRTNLIYSNVPTERQKPVYCIELDKTFPSIRKTSVELNLLQSNLSSHLSRNTPKSVGGYHFKYANE